MNACPTGCDITLSIQLPTRYIPMGMSPFGHEINGNPQGYRARHMVQGYSARHTLVIPKGCERDT